MQKRSVLKENDARPILLNLLTALAYLHGKRIVHRDLKPENLLLESGKQWATKIADFGLAAVLPTPDSKLYKQCGSPGYIAPEVLQEKGYDCQADIFSVGAIFYKILTGANLIRGSNTEEKLSKNKACQFEFNEHQWKYKSEAARNLVNLLLKENPEERITASQALQHPWFNQDRQQDGPGVAGA